MMIVGAGASAGGFEALKGVLAGIAALPRRPRAAVVVVLHIDASAHELLLEQLPKDSPLPCVAARDGETLEPDRVYIVPGRKLAELDGDTLRLRAADKPESRRAPIDHFLQSLAQEKKERAIGLILSGTGSDGALGLKAVSDAGGMTIVQDPATALQDEMPQSALDTGAVDHVLAPERAAVEIMAYAEHLAAASDERELHEELLSLLPLICDALLHATGHNFKHYKTTTLLRRTMRRLHVLRLRSGRDYLERLRAEPAEAQRLFQDLLISVTAFFRDAEAFESLAANVLPKLLASRAGEPLRIWVAGCATGEEAYTIAMLLREQMDRMDPKPAVQIFATDIDEHALATARAGVYPVGIAEEVSPERLKRFFVRNGEHYHVTKELRELVLFSTHNVINDPPFSKLDLISCRNLLIYLGSHLQKKLIPLFHFALRSGGYLLLGPSENITGHQELFRLIDAKNRISQRLPTAIRSSGFPIGRSRTGPVPRPPNVPSTDDVDVYLVMQRIILDEFAPKGLVVDDSGKILCAAGDLDRYLTVTEGVFQNNVVSLARRGLRVAVRAALAEAVRHRRKVVRSGITVRGKERTEHVQLTVQPMPQLGEECGMYLVVFADTPPSAPVTTLGETPPTQHETTSIIEHLERELETTRNDLERAVQDLEAANEELKSSNEELLSMNEELQSANEELQASKDELQGANDSLVRANDDLENLLASTRIATIFLDLDQKIRRVTAPATAIYNVQVEDSGRSLSDFTHNARTMPPLPSALELSQAAKPIEHEIEMRDGSTFLRRVMPYTAQHGGPAGVVVTFIDITERRVIEKRLQASENLYRAIGESIDFGVWVCDPSGRNTYASESFLKLVGMTQEQCSDFGWGKVLHPDELGPTLAAWSECVRTGANWDQEHRFLGADGHWHPVLARGVPVRDARGDIVCWAGINLDISRLKRSEEALRESEQRFRMLADSAPVLIWIMGEHGCEYVNHEYLRYVGTDQEGVQGMGWARALHPDDAATYIADYQRAFEQRQPFHSVARLRRHDGEYRWIQSVGLPRRAATGEFVGFVGSSVDVTDIKRAEEALLEVDRRKDEFLAILAHELRNPLGAIVNANLVAGRAEVDPPTRQWAHAVIERQARQLTRLVDDLLDLSRITSGKVRLQKQPIDAVLVLQKVLEGWQRNFEQKRQRVALEVDSAPLIIDADPARLEQIFVNVLGNANKYTDAGGRIEVTVGRRDGYAVVRVKDTGRGIAPEMLPRIFDAFTQADDSLDRNQSGLGLGLTVVKHLLDEHAGYVRAESDGLGHGSAFELGIPLRPDALVEVSPTPERQPVHTTPRRVLLIEDNTDNAETLKLLLEEAGHTVEALRDGRDVVAAYERFRADVVLLDLGLPGLDGYTIAETLRRNGASCPIVALSGYGLQRDRDRSRAAGIDRHLVKPVELQTLLAALASDRVADTLA